MHCVHYVHVLNMLSQISYFWWWTEINKLFLDVDQNRLFLLPECIDFPLSWNVIFDWVITSRPFFFVF